MITAFLMASIVASAVPAPTQKTCSAAEQLKDLNIPVNRSDSATEIAHAVLISQGGTLRATLVSLRDGAIWVWWGEKSDADPRLQQILGMQGARHGELGRVPAAALEELMRAGYQLTSCY